MNELTWISQEAHRIHDWFVAIFYLLVTVILLLGIFIEYFKWPLGGTPSFGPLVGRALVAAIMLHTYPEVANTIADISDAVSTHLGGISEISNALDKMGEKVDQLTWSWTSVRQSVIMVLSYLSFFLLYFSVHVAQAFYLYALVLLFIFSPILIALFVHPKTAGATGGLYRSLIEISLWKPVWCVIATILWSTGISGIQAEGSPLNLLTAICFSLIAAGSLVLTPILVHFLAEKGVSGLSRSLADISIPGVGVVTPRGVMAMGVGVGKRSFNSVTSAAEHLTKSRYPRAHKAIQNIPRFRVPKRSPLMERKTRNKNKGEKEVMRFTVAWAAVLKENLSLRAAVFSLGTTTLFLGITSARLSLKAPLLIERGCHTGIAKPADSSRSETEIQRFLTMALPLRFNSAAPDGRTFLSDQEFHNRIAEQQDLEKKGIRQSILVNAVMTNNGDLEADLDRIVSVGTIRSVFSFPVKVTLSTIARTEANPYGLLIANVSPIEQKEEK